MPQAIPAAIGFLASGTAAAVVTRIAISVGLSVLSSKLFGPKIAENNALNAIQVTSRDTLAWRTMVYGQAKVSGPVRYNNLSGTNNEDLWFVVPMCDGQSDDIVSVFLDGDEIPKADIDWTAGEGSNEGTGSGEVSTSAFQGSNGEKAVRIYYYLGHDDQPVSSQLDAAFGEIDSNFRLRGASHAVFRLRYNENTEEIWQKLGQPQTLAIVMKGRRVYDPRLDSTNGGSGLHRYTDSTTWEWSDNSALCLAHYLMVEMGVASATGIDWTACADAADDCDVLVAVPTASTEKRFTCNGALSHGQTHKQNLDALLSSMDGRLSYAGGVYKMRASVWEASSVSLNEDNIAGGPDGSGPGLVVRGSAPRSDRFNTVKPIFVDPDQNYEQVDAPQVSSATYVTRDGGKVLDFDLLLPCTNSVTMAQRVGKRILNRGNAQQLVEYPANSIGAKVAIGDVLDLTIAELSWSAKTFRCINWQELVSDDYPLLLREDVAANYDDPLEGEYGSSDWNAVTAPADVVPPPSTLGAASVSYGIQLSWVNPATTEFAFIDVYESSTDQWSAAVKIASTRADSLLVAHSSGETRYYWIRARRYNGDLSDRFPNSDTSTITSTASGDATPVQLAGAMLSDAVYSTDAEVSYRLASTGEEQSYEGDGGTHADIGDWLLEGSNSDYECRLTVNSGDNPTGSSLATWLALSTTRTWTLSDTSEGDGAESNDCTIEIRDQASGDVLASKNLTMSADRQAPALTLSGGSYNAFNFGANARVDIKVDDDGNVYRRNNLGSYSQIAAGSDWIRPASSAPGAYEVRYTNATGDTGDLAGTVAEDTWHPLTTSDFAVWIVTTGVDSVSATFDIEIRNGNSGGADESTSYTLSATREDI